MANDLLQGDSGNNTLYGEDGNDTLLGYDGADWLYGNQWRPITGLFTLGTTI
jgi:Ca2+-binding RTX toxin-like protein